jgi:hypothetical protein
MLDDRQNGWIRKADTVLDGRWISILFLSVLTIENLN